MPQVTTLIGSGARTSNGNGGPVDVSPATTLRCQLNVTAASGTTPTLTVTVQDTIDGTNYNAVASFAQVTTTGISVLNITGPFTDKVRVAYVIGGTTPSFTFAVIAYAE